MKHACKYVRTRAGCMGGGLLEGACTHNHNTRVPRKPAGQLAHSRTPTNVRQVREEVAKKATLYRQLQKQKAEMHEHEFQDLLEQGLNPYEVARRRDIEAQVGTGMLLLVVVVGRHDVCVNMVGVN